MTRWTWRDEARPGALRDAYPFGERKYHPYKIWLDEIRSQTGKKKKRMTPAKKKKVIAMKNQIPLFILMITTIIIAGCTSVPAQALALQTTQVVKSANATATINWIATADNAQAAARQAQQTSDAATRLLVDATITHEANVLQLALVTQAAEQIQQQKAQATQDAARYTATAYATAVPLTQTQQVRDNNAAATERAMTITAPTQIVAIANAKALSETATARAWAETWIMITVGAVVLALAFAMVTLVSIKPEKKRRTPPIQEQTPQEMKPIPMAPEPNTNTMIRAEIHCATEQLVQLADGITKEEKTLAFGQWKATNVYPVLHIIRQYFLRHKFAEELTGKNGELVITEDGMNFLQDTSELREPPMPHVCIG